MVTLFSKKGCSNCNILKEELSKAGIMYNEVVKKNIVEIEDCVEGTECENKIYKLKSFPILQIDNNWIGDFQEAMNRFSEPLLSKNTNKYAMYPITYHDVYELYKKARASYWQPEEIDLSKDGKDWVQLTGDEQHFISYILAFFSASDGIVNENININFSQEIEVAEVRAFYAFQEAIEAVHSETYSILLDKYITNPLKKQYLQNGISNISAVKEKAEWAQKYMSVEKPFAQRLLAFACVEGIYFSGSFCAIFWLKKRNLLPGLAFSNELISRDEALHTEFAILLYSYLKNKLPQNIVHNIVGDAVKNEKAFILEALPCKLIGMNHNLMSQYIEYVADRLLTQLGYSKLYNVENPFEFMEIISLNGKTNFFEKRVGEYAKAGVMSNNEDMVFELDADF
uniref:Uncharacterized protein n=1 Tax=viral metagenome TaxID=1070528 RepID=A0A6C0F5V2_9ZZZZ|tara:strand:- start:2872 stop:4065 length:1194 start_codon:yes stop_codon:yes gene_type:complete